MDRPKTWAVKNNAHHPPSLTPPPPQTPPSAPSGTTDKPLPQSPAPGIRLLPTPAAYARFLSPPQNHGTAVRTALLKSPSGPTIPKLLLSKPAPTRLNHFPRPML